MTHVGLRIFFLWFAGPVVIVLAGVVTYWGLEVLLASHSDYSRGLWEGGAVALVINASLALENFVFRRVDAKKKEARL